MGRICLLRSEGMHSCGKTQAVPYVCFALLDFLRGIEIL